jgi:hypothetical protein
LPPALKGRFAAEPKWVDLSAYREGADNRDAKFTELAADFAAAVRGLQEAARQARDRQTGSARTQRAFHQRPDGCGR